MMFSFVVALTALGQAVKPLACCMDPSPMMRLMAELGTIEIS
jgi:hypothetical protein